MCVCVRTHVDWWCRPYFMDNAVQRVAPATSVRSAHGFIVGLFQVHLLTSAEHRSGVKVKTAIDVGVVSGQSYRPTRNTSAGCAKRIVDDRHDCGWRSQSPLIDSRRSFSSFGRDCYRTSDDDDNKRWQQTVFDLAVHSRAHQHPAPLTYQWANGLACVYEHWTLLIAAIEALSDVCTVDFSRKKTKKRNIVHTLPRESSHFYIIIDSFPLFASFFAWPEPLHRCWFRLFRVAARSFNIKCDQSAEKNNSWFINFKMSATAHMREKFRLLSLGIFVLFARPYRRRLCWLPRFGELLALLLLSVTLPMRDTPISTH